MTRRDAITYAMTYAIIQALCQSTLRKHFIKALYPSTLSKHFTQALYQSTLSKHFIRVFLKHFRNTRQGITKVLRQGITTRYYDKVSAKRQGAESRPREQNGAWDAQIGEFSARTLRFGRPKRQGAGSRPREHNGARAHAAAHRGPKVVTGLLTLEKLWAKRRACKGRKNRTSPKHFTQALYQSTLHKHFIQALYTSTLSKHFTQALYQSTLSKHFIKVFLKHFRNTCQGITKVLRQGITTRYYDIFVQPSYRGEVLRSITCFVLSSAQQPPY